jgi:hypothetical protein
LRITDNHRALAVLEMESGLAKTVAVMGRVGRMGGIWDISILTVQGTWERTVRAAPSESEGFQAVFSLIDFVRGWPTGTTASAKLSTWDYDGVLRHTSHWSRVEGPISKEERRARIKKIWTEAPRAMAPMIVKEFKREAYQANRPRVAHWPDLYPQHVGALDAWFAADAKDLECVDNHRVADVSSRGHRRAYWRQARLGCCGSRDTVITIGDKTYLIGYNYGH